MTDALFMLSIALAVILGGFLLLWGQHYSSGWRGSSKSGARLPKGSLGWPIAGETFAFIRAPGPYAASHVKRYGKIFKSSLFLQKAIVGTTPEFTKFVMSNSSLFVSGWPKNVMDVIGPKCLMFQNGARHTSIKRLFQKHLVPDALRSKVHVLETIILENMASWEKKGTIVGKKGTERIISEIAIWLLLGIRDIDSTARSQKALECLGLVNKAFASVPLNLPGTPYNRGLKAKAVLSEYFKYLVEERKGQANTQTDMLGVLLAAQDDPKAREEVKDLDQDMIGDNLILYWAAAYDSTSTALTWILKYLGDNPEVFRRVQAEQREILNGQDPSVEGPRLSFEDTQKMVYTQKFYQEVHRMLSIVPIVVRKAAQDVENEGYLIPKGWAVSSLYNLIHTDPANYADPESFNPDRFDEKPKPYTYLAFSAGPHMCPGMEASKLISLIFIHHLTTKYTYESAAPDKGFEYNSFINIKGGYPINFRRAT